MDMGTPLEAGSGDRRAPRDFFENHKQFGRSLNAAPIARPLDGEDLALWRAAQFQHSVAFVVNERLKMLGKPRKQLALEIGTSLAYLGKILRGEVGLSAVQLGHLEAVVGPIALVSRYPFTDQTRHRVSALPGTEPTTDPLPKAPKP